MSIENFQALISIASSCIVATLAVLIFFLNLPEGKEWRRLRNAKTFLCISFTAIAVMGFSDFLPENIAKHDGFTFNVSLIVSMLQTLLITATLLLFISQRSLQRKNIILQVAAIAAFCIVLTTAELTGTKFACTICRTVALAAYLTQICAYIYIFRCRYKKFVVYAAERCSVEEPRIKWLKWNFRGEITGAAMALTFCVSILTGISDEYKKDIFSVLTIFSTAYYLFMASRFYSYCVKSSFIVTSTYDGDASEPIEMPERDKKFQTDLNRWVAEKRFLQKDIALEDFASQLNATPRYIYYYFRTYMNTNFRTWRTELRIHEAETLLAEHPDLSLEKIGEMTGFNHRANFFQQFQKVTGKKPSDYRTKTN